MSGADYRWPVTLQPGERLIFEVSEVDYEVRLFWNDTAVLYVGPGAAPSKPFDLVLGRKYVIRYNNNDGGQGALSCHIASLDASGVRSILYPIEQSGVEGPFVLEVPFLLYQTTA